MTTMIPGKGKTESSTSQPANSAPTSERGENTASTTTGTSAATPNPDHGSQEPEIVPVVTTGSDNTIATTVTADIPENQPGPTEVGEARKAASDAIVDATQKAAEAINTENVARMDYNFRDEPGFEDEMPVEELDREPVAAYKHRRISRFKVGRHVFKDGLLYLYTEEDNDDFLQLYKGLDSTDKTQIVKYDWRKAASVESPVDAQRAIRGALSARSIKDPKVNT